VKGIAMKITLDRSIDAAYIYLTSRREEKAVKTYPCDPIEVGGQINLDFNSNGQLIGIEVLDATRLLPIDLLQDTEYIG
jgi:uncharacterized protein YuzE